MLYKGTRSKGGVTRSPARDSDQDDVQGLKEAVKKSRACTDGVSSTVKSVVMTTFHL